MGKTRQVIQLEIVEKEKLNRRKPTDESQSNVTVVSWWATIEHEAYRCLPVGYSVHGGQHQKTSVSDVSNLGLCVVVPI